MPTDITSQLSTASNAITLPSGDYSISSSVTVNVDLTMLSGATIAIPLGAVLTFAEGLNAPLDQIFQGAGLVDMNDSHISAAYPEWWGAKINDGTFDNAPILMAAVAAHPVVQLLAADYFTASTWKIATGHRTVSGAGSHWSPTNQGTRIVINSATATVMQVGSDSEPSGGINQFLTAVTVSKLSLSRGTAPHLATPGQEAVGPTGLRAQYLLYCRFDQIRAEEHSTAFYIGGCVSTRFRECEAFRSIPGVGSGSPVFYGFYLAGYLDIGGAGGNASLYMTDCASSIGGSPGTTQAYGIGLDGAFADTFITRFETSSMPWGIVAMGVSDNSSSTVRKAGNLDLHIIMPILDQCTNRGIEIGNLSEYAAVEIVDPYIALAPGALAAIHLHDGGGNTTIAGGQFIGFGDNEAGGNSLGLLGERQSGLRLSGTKIIGHNRPVGLNNCLSFDIAADISNPNQPASQAAVSLSSCDRGRIVPFIRGQSGAFPQGVDLTGSGNAHIHVDVTGIDPACVTGGSTNKLRIAGTPRTLVGAYGTHFVSGVVS